MAAVAGPLGRAAEALRRGLEAGAFGEPLRQAEAAVVNTAWPTGQATKAVGDAVGRTAEQALDPFSHAAEEGIEAAIAASPPPVRAFLERNRVAIRASGVLQALGGVGEAGAGAGLLAGGIVAAPEGGLLATGAGAWMVARGYDDFNTGLKALISGEPHESGFTAALKSFGFTDREAEGISILTAGVTPAAAERMTTRELDNAVERALLKDALQPFGPPLKLTPDGSFWREVDILKRGLAWEAADRRLTGFEQTPVNFKTFDQWSADGRIAMSNKTLDIERDFYKPATPKRVQASLKGMIDDVAGWKEGKRSNQIWDRPSLPSVRHLHLLLPSGRPFPGQGAQIAAARAYARSRGVVLQIRYGR